MKLVIFGGGGFVGGNLARIARDNGWSVAIADSFLKPEGSAGEWLRLDITDGEAVREAMRKAAPDAAVNVAAIADIDRAEQNRELARAVNVEGARNIAFACREAGAKLVFFSSDAVFDGKEACYAEGDAPDPVNYYGRTKAEAENAVLAACPRAAVIRISLVLGPPSSGGNSFVSALRRKLEESQEVLCPADEVRTPVDVFTLCRAVLELAQNDYAGILHVGGTESVNRYELTRRLALAMGFNENLVKEKPPGGDAPGGGAPGRAPRHKNGVIDVTKARQVLKTEMVGLDETIRRALEVEL